MDRSPFASSFGIRSLVVLLAGLASAALSGCGSDSNDDSSRCGHATATGNLSVVFMNYNDVGGETSCAEVDVDVFAGPSTGTPSPSGTVEAPSGAPIASARSTLNTSAEFTLQPGEYVACVRAVTQTCGALTLTANRLYGTFVGGPAIEWKASEDASAN